MTGVSYLIARLLAICGVCRKNKYLTDATDESHLLKQAEDILGEELWEYCEEIEDINVEYWTLRKLNQEKAELQKQLDIANQFLDEGTSQRKERLQNINDDCLDREEEHARLLDEMKVLDEERNGVIARAHQARRKIEACRTKIEVLAAQSETEVDISHEKGLLVKYTQDFEELKILRNFVAAKITALSDKIESVKELISRDREGLKSEASAVFHNIGKANRESSRLASDIGLIDLDMQKSFIKIGYYLSMNAGVDESCTQVCKKHMVMVNQIRSLRESILRNKKIAAMAS